jgi:hypothetical protein
VKLRTDRHRISAVVAGCVVLLVGLAAATYAPTQTTFTKAQLFDGWKYGGFDTAYPGYAKDPLGVVHLRGTVQGGTDGTEAFLLPKALAPSHDMWLPVEVGPGQGSALMVATTGQVIPDGPPTSYYLPLDDVSFVAGRATTIRFTHAQLQNGWRYGGNNSAWPGYAIDPLGVVHLRGGLFDGTSGTSAFVLPKALRPSHPIWLPIYSSGFTGGSLSVSPDGQVTPTGDEVASYASLDGVSFVAASATKIRFTNAKLTQRWKYAGLGSARPGYGKDPLGVVHLRGAMRDGRCDTVALTLPTGLRPSHWLNFPIYTLGGTRGWLAITRVGHVYPCGGAAAIHGYASLDGMSFVAGQ